MGMEFETIESLVAGMKGCSSCRLRGGCTQVVAPTGQINRPILLICGEAPGEQEDEEGTPFVGVAGQTLRDVLRRTEIINKSNTIITNVLNCRPPGNKFPKDQCPEICISKWFWEIVRLTAPERMLLLGSMPLKYVAGMDGITACRGQWVSIRSIRTMATFHPSYVMRKDNEGVMTIRDTFEKDINTIAAEVKEIEEARKSQTTAGV